MISHKLLQRVIYIYKRRKAISNSLIEIKEGLLQFVLEALSLCVFKDLCKEWCHTNFLKWMVCSKIITLVIFAYAIKVNEIQ